MTDEAMSPLRRRMIEDMTIRKFAPKTQHDYVQRIKNFAAFVGRSPANCSHCPYCPSRPSKPPAAPPTNRKHHSIPAPAAAVA
jgi:hypothetical protein